MEFSKLVETTLTEQAVLQKQSMIDKVQAALDVIGFEPTIGTAADAINTLISTLRAAFSKETDERKKHIINAGISAISLIPFADLIKLIKLKHYKKTAIKGARVVKNYGKQQQTNRFNVSESSVSGGAESVFGGGVVSTAAVYSGDNYAPGDARIPNSIYGGVITRPGMKSKRKRRKKKRNKS
jgi:hypothetical protein